MIAQVPMPFVTGAWHHVKRSHWRARSLADRHYSRQTPGAVDFMGAGRVFVLLTHCGRAVWGVIENLDPAGVIRWRCSIFRNEGAGLSSELIREATVRTHDRWRSRYGALPPVPLTTEIDAKATRRGRSSRSRPGECFYRAGWRYSHTTNGRAHGRADLDVLIAPEPTRLRWEAPAA